MIPIAIICVTAILFWFLHVVNRNRCIDGHHAFEPRYSEESTPPIIGPGAHPIFILEGKIEAATAHKQTYIHDICIHCGKIAESPHPKSITITHPITPRSDA